MPGNSGGGESGARENRDGEKILIFKKRKNACCCFNGGALKIFGHFCLFILI